MSTNDICFYEDVDKRYNGCNLKTLELLDCALIGACAVIRSNMVCLCKSYITQTQIKLISSALFAIQHVLDK